MSKTRALRRARTARVVAVTAAVSLALTGVALGASAANADVPTRVVFQPLIGAETANGYPATSWFVGDSSHAGRGTTFDSATGDLSLNEDTQLLYQPSTAKHDLTALVNDGLTADVRPGGDMTFQIFVSWTGGFTTLRSADGTDAADATAAMSQAWISSKPVTQGGTNDTRDTLGNLIADIEATSQGSYSIGAVGIYGGENATTADHATEIASIQVYGTKYTFAGDVTVGSAATRAVVQTGAIGQESAVTGYPTNAWFYGSNSYLNTGGVATGEGAIALNPGTQLLHQFTNATRPDSLESFIDSGVSWTEGGASAADAYFQIPLTFGPTHTFTTLRPAPGVPATGVNTVEYGADWTSSKAVPGFAAGDTATLGQLVKAIDSVGGTQTLFGYGVFADVTATPAPTTLNAVQAGTTSYTFADTKSLAFNSLTIVGAAMVDTALTAVPDISSPNGATYSYKWYANGHAIAGGTHATYTPGASKLGMKISVRVTANKSGYTTASATSAKTANVVKGVFAHAAVTITGTAKVGATLKATVTSTQTGTHSYQWYRDGVKIHAATKSTRVLTVRDLNAVITVHSRLTKAGFTSTTLRSASTARVNPGTFTLATATLTGTVKVGKTLTVHARASVTGTTKSYLYYAGGFSNGNLIKVSTHSTFTIPSYLLGETVSVVVLAFKAGYVSAFSMSAQTATIL